MLAAARTVLYSVLCGGVPRWVLHLRDVSLVVADGNERGASAGDDSHLAVDRNSDHPGERREGCWSWLASAALCLRVRVGRLVGDVHHHARRSDGICVFGVWLLFLLDDSR